MLVSRAARAAALLGCLLAAGILSAGCSGPEAGSAHAGDGAAEATGLLHGVVVDEALRPLAGVAVEASYAGGPPLAATTGDDGTFRFGAVAPGSYVVTASQERRLTATTLAQVVAGEEDPRAVQLVLELLRDEVPFATAIAYDVFVGCAFSYGNLCSAPAQGGFDVLGDRSAHLFYDEVVAQGRVPDLVQGEATWDPSLPTSAELYPIYGWSTPAAWQAFAYEGTFFAVSQPSPSFDRVTAEMAAEAELGVRSGLVVEFYSGRPGGLPTGLTLNQRVSLYLHLFYGFLPADDWRFVATGAAPQPPA